MAESLFKFDRVSKIFHSASSFFNPKQTSQTIALHEVSFDIYKGETLGIVGESGSGKSTIAKLMVLLEDISEGEIIYYGMDGGLNLSTADRQEISNYRQQVQMVFQDPYSSLNPMLKIIDSIEAPMKAVEPSKAKRLARMEEIMEEVGLNKSYLYRYPHELSGGQRQRVNIARVIGLQPEVIIFDESTSALDVSVQAQILNLIKKIQAQYQMTFIFISHDLGVVEYMADRILVLYHGEIMEILSDTPLSEHAQHDYTKKLIAAVPGVEEYQLWQGQL